MRRFAYAGAVDLSDEVTLADDDDDEDELWHVLMGPGDVKVVSLDRLSDLFRWDLINEQSYVWKPGMKDWQQLFLLIGPTEQPEEEEPPWSVAVAPGEIKQLSLEQLDDWYRLDLIDARTLIWKPGMASWQPLGVVAGIETEPPRSPPTGGVSLAPSAPPAESPMPSSSPPVALTLPAPAQRSGGAERWLLGAALAAGLVVTLYRNDLITEMARSVHEEAAFERLGRHLGGPGFGTVREVDALLESKRLRLPEVRVPEALVALEIGHEHTAAAPASSVEAASSAKPEAAAATPAPADPSETAVPAAHSFGRVATPRPRHARSRGTQSSRPAADDIMRRPRKASRGKGTEYDPLNPKL